MMDQAREEARPAKTSSNRGVNVGRAAKHKAETIGSPYVDQRRDSYVYLRGWLSVGSASPR